jgi:hypothetical protein
MVVLEVKVGYFACFNVERYAPVAGNRHAPSSGSIAGQLMNAPARWTDNAIHIACRNQCGQDVARPVHHIGPNLARIVSFDETPEATMPDRTYIHSSMYAITVQISSDTLGGSRSESTCLQIDSIAVRFLYTPTTGSPYGSKCRSSPA